MSEQFLSKLARRVLSALGRAKLTFSNDDGPIQKVQGRFNELEVIDDLPRAAEFGFTSNPPDGTDIVVVFLSGDRSNGVVLGTNHQASRPRGLAKGETMLYSLIGQRIYLSEAGIEIEAKDLPVIVRNAKSVTIQSQTVVKVVAPAGVELETTLLKVSGDIIDNADTNDKTMAEMRLIFDDHDHGGVQRGDVDTYGPNQRMG